MRNDISACLSVKLLSKSALFRLRRPVPFMKWRDLSMKDLDTLFSRTERRLWFHEHEHCRLTTSADDLHGTINDPTTTGIA